MPFSMNGHLDKANYNQDFLNCIEAQFPQDYYDWKITVVFYTALHLVEALAAKNSQPLGGSHSLRNYNLNPKHNNATLKLTNLGFKHYYRLYKLSQTARYDGFLSNRASYLTFMNKKYQEAQQRIADFKVEIGSMGLTIP